MPSWHRNAFCITGLWDGKTLVSGAFPSHSVSKAELRRVHYCQRVQAVEQTVELLVACHFNHFKSQLVYLDYIALCIYHTINIQLTAGTKISPTCFQSHATFVHYSDAIIGMMASQITSVALVYSTIYSGADQRKYRTPRHWPLCVEFTGDRWIPRTNGQ